MRAIGHDGLAIPGRVELAHEPAFKLGLIDVHPATRELVSADHIETIEPRVMQVLVALMRADGRVVTRDELIEWCWGGRVVGEDAINRVIARIRQVASGIGSGSFGVATITKVGYRLEIQGRDGPPAQISARPVEQRAITTRRGLIAGGSAAAAGAALLVWRPWVHRPSAEAQELYRRADIAWKAGLDDQARQAVFYLERAVQIDPKFAAAWGGLAVAYTHFLEGYGEAEMASIPGRVRASAGRALALDPDNGDARLALACIKPNFRNWGEMEPRLRQISSDYPSLWLAHGRLAILMYQVGRLNEGIRLHRRVLEIDRMIALPYAVIARALSSLGRVQEADAVLDEAQRHWPAHPMIWSARYFHQLFNGRPQAAMATVLNPDARPSGIPQSLVDSRLRLARAIDTRRREDVDAVIEEHRRLALTDIGFTPLAAAIFALLDRIDLTFDSLARYYFNRGPFGTGASIGPYTRRYTDLLFSTPLTRARSDPRFATLLQTIGLEKYWRTMGSGPDYRRR